MKTCAIFLIRFSSTLTIRLNRLTRNIEHHLGRILAVDVTHDDLVGALIIGLRLPHAEGDRVGLRVREELKAATIDDLGDAFVELESWRRCTLHRDGEIRRRVCKNNINI